MCGDTAAAGATREFDCSGTIQISRWSKFDRTHTECKIKCTRREGQSRQGLDTWTAANCSGLPEGKITTRRPCVLNGQTQESVGTVNTAVDTASLQSCSRRGRYTTSKTFEPFLVIAEVPSLCCVNHKGWLTAESRPSTLAKA